MCPVRSVLLVPPSTPNLRSPSRFLIWMARRQAPNLALGGFFGVVWMGTQAAVPLVLGAAIEAVIQRQAAAIIDWSLGIIGLGIVQAAAGGLRHREAVTNRLIASSTVQRLLARQASELGGDLALHVASGEVAGIGSSDVQRIATVLDILPRLIGAVVAAVAVAGVMVVVSIQLGLVVLVGVPLVALGVGPLLRPLERRQRAQRELIGAASSITADTVVGLRVLRGLGGERVFATRFAAASQRIRTAAVRTARLEATLYALQVLLPGLLLVTMTGVGADLVLAGRISPGTLVTAYGEAAFLLIPLQTVVEAASYFTAGLVAASRVTAVLRRHRDLPLAASPAPLPPPGRLVDEVTGVQITPAVLTAVVMPDPEGAEVFADRLGRYLDPPDGTEVTLAGVALRRLLLADARSQILVLPKDGILLAGTISEVVDPPTHRASRASLADALGAAQANDIVNGLPDGLNTELPERGRTLSGGQRQRLLLAAAIRADPEVLVLDEPTSAVDAHTEAAIARGLRLVRSGRTTVVITSSPLLCEAADEVILVDDGQVVVGRHHQLLGSNRRYRELVARGGDSPGDGGAPS